MIALNRFFGSHKIENQQRLRPMIKIKTPICLSFKLPSALRQRTDTYIEYASLDGDLKSGADLGALILIMGLSIIFFGDKV